MGMEVRSVDVRRSVSRWTT